MGFTFNGISSKSMGIETRMETENRIPSPRNQTGTLAGRHGILDFGETLSEREIGITCFIPPGKTDAGLLALKDALMGWLNPDNGLCRLALDSEPGRVYLARIRDGISYERMVRNTGTFKVLFFCPDPFAYAVPDEIFSLTSSAAVVRNKGNCGSAPLYKLQGMLADSGESVRITVNGEKMEIKGPLSASETLEVDARDMTAKAVSADGTVRNALGQMAVLNFPYLKPGANTVTIGVDGGTLSLLTVEARSRWL